MKSVVVTDYGVGNLLSVRRAFEKIGATVVQTSNPDEVRRADRLVVPGVGAFADCMQGIRRLGLLEPIIEFARSGRPMLGICVGMQILLNKSFEFGEHKGLGLIPGEVTAVPSTDPTGAAHKIPHIGWSRLELPDGSDASCWKGTVLESVRPGAFAYFVHSFTAHPLHKQHRLCDSDYDGCRISAAVRKDNIQGTQFHPEKSGPVGLRVIAGFLTR